MSRTKIVCTIGPASQSKTMIEKLIKAGMDCTRLNFSHGTYREHAEIIKNIRNAGNNLYKDIVIIQDLQGPKIRVGKIMGEGLLLKKNTEITLQEGKESTGTNIPINYQGFAKLLTANDVILMDDGKIDLKVRAISKDKIKCRVQTGGLLTSNKGINLPTIKTRVESITKKDKLDLKFGIKNQVDYVALSFVQSPQDITELRKLIVKLEKEFKFREKNIPPTKIIAKIEKPQAIENIDDIIESADGIMIARGDLGVEIPIQRVPVLQKNIIKKCLDKAKPVIVATQMLESMIEKPIPTRAEVSDVANAVIDHADAVMLSGESAMGKYPIQAVKIMDEVIKNTEDSAYDDLVPLEKESVPANFAASFSAVCLAKKVGAKGIVTTASSGEKAQYIARYRPEIPIIALVSHEKIKRQLNLSWGIKAYVLSKYSDNESLMLRSIDFIKENKIFNKNEKVIFIGSDFTGKTKPKSVVKEINL